MKQIIQKLLEKEATQKRAETDKMAQQENVSNDGRRNFFRKTAALGGMALGGFMFSPFEDTVAQASSKVNRNSAPFDSQHPNGMRNAPGAGSGVRFNYKKQQLFTMNKIFFVLALAITVSIAGRAQSADEKKVAAAVQALRQAMLDGDKAQLEAITAPELSYGHSSGKMEDRATYIQSLVSKTSDFVTMDLTQQTIRIIGNTALVRHNLHGETVDSGKPGTANLGVLLVWQKQQGKWKLIARQAFKLL